MDAAADLLTKLCDAPVAGVTLTPGTNAMRGQPRPGVNGPAVFLLNDGGPPRVPYFGGDDVVTARVEVVVRGGRDSFAAGEAFALACLQKLHRAQVAGYVVVLVGEAQPQFEGEDEAGAPEWVFSAFATFRHVDS